MRFRSSVEVFHFNKPYVAYVGRCKRENLFLGAKFGCEIKLPTYVKNSHPEKIGSLKVLYTQDNEKSSPLLRAAEGTSEHD